MVTHITTNATKIVAASLPPVAVDNQGNIWQQTRAIQDLEPVEKGQVVNNTDADNNNVSDAQKLSRHLCTTSQPADNC